MTPERYREMLGETNRPGPWKPGIPCDTIVADRCSAVGPCCDEDSLRFYGGCVVAESMCTDTRHLLLTQHRLGPLFSALWESAVEMRRVMAGPPTTPLEWVEHKVVLGGFIEALGALEEFRP